MQEHSLTFDTVSRSSASAKRFSSASAEEAAVCLHVANSLQSVPPKKTSQNIAGANALIVIASMQSNPSAEAHALLFTFCFVHQNQKHPPTPSHEPWAMDLAPSSASHCKTSRVPKTPTKKIRHSLLLPWGGVAVWPFPALCTRMTSCLH